MITHYDRKRYKTHFDLYTYAYGPGKMMWVLYDPDTEYYMRRTVDVKSVKPKDLDSYVAQSIPSDLDEKYVESFTKALKLNWFQTYHVHHNGPEDYARQIPGLFAEVKHPIAGLQRTIHDIIIDLNDGHGWSREKIADWLETLDENPIITPQGDDD